MHIAPKSGQPRVLSVIGGGLNGFGHVMHSSNTCFKVVRVHYGTLACGFDSIIMEQQLRVMISKSEAHKEHTQQDACQAPFRTMEWHSMGIAVEPRT